MTQVLQFPTKAVRDWQMIEGAIADILAKADASAHMVDHVNAKMKEHVLRLNREFSVNIDFAFTSSTPAVNCEAIVAAVKDGFTKFESAVQSQMNEVIFEFLKLEIRLYIAQNGHS